MNTDAWIRRRMELFGVPLTKWQKADLIEEVKRLRELNSGYVDTIVKLNGINGKVSTKEIDAALSNLAKKK